MNHKYQIENKSDYTQLKTKMYVRLLCITLIALVIISILYTFLWRDRGGDWLVSIFQNLFKMNSVDSLNLYQQLFRNYADTIWIVSIVIVFFSLLRFFLSWFTQYFEMINQGINALLNENIAEISLPPEMIAIERKLNTAKQVLKQRALEIQLAEQRKNDLVVYLAHDIRTPLTSVIGYLNLLEEAPEMPVTQRAKYVHITLSKAYHLEKMMNEFFEITRYNLQQITLVKEKIDIYYMLVQLTDELSTLLNKNENTITLNANDSLFLYADPEKLARAFNNILKNAVAYSYPKTEITISTEKKNNTLFISFRNKGKTISKENLSVMFEKFVRLDESRTSNTGGTGLGLSIAKEIINLHNGTITVSSKNDTVIFSIILPFVN